MKIFGQSGQGGWAGVPGIGSDVLAGRLVIKQRARAKYLHKSVLPCAATPEKKLILLLHDRAITRTNASAAERARPGGGRWEWWGWRRAATNDVNNNR